MRRRLAGMMALSPLMVFLVLYLVLSILMNDFYKVPITVAFLVACVYAISITRGLPIDKRVNLFSRGAGSPSMMLMIWIFILAGAFANSAKEMGGIDATVNMTLLALPSELLLPGIFLASCFISLSIGTSVGTIVALTPVAVGVAEATSVALPLMVALVVGGAYFGDNLSFISDTTIIATRSQGCKLSDKFKVNSMIVIPAAVIALVLYYFLGRGVAVSQDIVSVDWFKVVPYLSVLILAVAGVNVMLVLTVGIVLTGIVGMMSGTFDLYDWFGAMGGGIIGMGELIIITMLAGGLLELIRHNGGIDFILTSLTKRVHGKRGAEACIAILVSLADLCTANNTVAIITVGSLANDIADKYGVDKRKSASILDTFSCLMQGLIPYGAQMLIASGLAQISPISIIPYLYYPMVMGVCAILSIVFRYPRRYS